MAVEGVQWEKHRGKEREWKREREKYRRESKSTIIGVVILITTKEKNCLMSKHTLVAVSSRFSYYFWLSGRTCICLTKKKNLRVCVCLSKAVKKRERESNKNSRSNRNSSVYYYEKHTIVYPIIIIIINITQQQQPIPVLHIG